MVFLLLILMALIAPVHVWSAPIPAGDFPGITFDSPLDNEWVTGQAVLLEGRVEDDQLAGGQILFRFTGEEGESLRVFVQLDGNRFSRYHLFKHAEAGTYQLDIFAGGAGAESLDFIGVYNAIRVSAGSGSIELPIDFFPGIEFDQSFSTQIQTDTGVIFSGRALDALMRDGQILFNFVPIDGGEELSVFINLEGDQFNQGYWFQAGMEGQYELNIFLGPAGGESLGFVGRFNVEAVIGEGVSRVPLDFFTGISFDRELAVEWEVGRDYWLEGSVAEDIVQVHLEVEGGEFSRQVGGGVVGGQFRILLRLTEGEVGPLTLRFFRERTSGEWIRSGELPIRAIGPLAAPRIQIGALALDFRPGEVVSLPLYNGGDAELRLFDVVGDGPFVVVDAPSALPVGESAVIRLRYDGDGGHSGQLRLLSNDPQKNTRHVALSGLGDRKASLPFLHRIADADGQLAVELDLDHHDYVLVLYSGAIEGVGEDAHFPFSIGGELPAARRAPDLGAAAIGGEVWVRQRERDLAEAYRKYVGRVSKPAAVQVEVGEKRTFIYEGIGRGQMRQVDATAVYVGDRAVAWLQDDLRADEENLTASQIAEVMDLFNREDYDVTVHSFGDASDVDGDGRVAFLFTHWVDDEEGIAGFFSASSVLPELAGGDGNQADLMFISPTQRSDFYRSLLVHEFQHLINFNEHVLVRRGEAEASWLNEGLSHLAEDLVSPFAESGQGENIAAFLRNPDAVGLIGDAGNDAARRGAAYLFVRSLQDRLGASVVQRLVKTGLADRVNVEEATGQSMDELLAYWGTLLYASGQGLSEHDQLNFSSSLLSIEGLRALPLPKVQTHAVGEPTLLGSLPARGVSFVRVMGEGVEELSISSVAESRVGVVLIPLPDGFRSNAYLPPDYVPGVQFLEPVPAVMVQGRSYLIGGRVEDPEVDALLLRYAGEDTLRFYVDLIDGVFEQSVAIANAGQYELEVFAGSGDGILDYVAGFAPVWVAAAEDITLVGENMDGLPESYVLGRAYPNPFNSSVLLPFVVPSAPEDMELAIYNVLGQRVRTLFRGVPEPGRHVLYWDGRDDAGQSLGSGVYLYRLEAGATQKTANLLLLR